MFRIKEIKKNGFKTLKNNIWTLVLAGIIVTLVFGRMSIDDNAYQTIKLVYDFSETVRNEGGVTSIKDLEQEKFKGIVADYSNRLFEQALYGDLGTRIQDYNKQNNIKKGIFYSALNIFTHGQSSVKEFIKGEGNTFSQSVVIMIIIGLIVLLIKILFINPLRVGNSRLFLESIEYKKTRLRVLEYSFKEHYYREAVSTMLRKDIYEFLWNLTIIGGFIKHYSYLMVEYITAENPSINPKDCINMSRYMMNGNKMKVFLFDASFLLWWFLDAITLGIAGLFITPYYEACKAELYRKLREDYIEEKKYNYENLNDDLLFNNEKNFATYENAKLGKNKEKKIIDIYELNNKYELWDYILFFFIFAFAGWIWEVGYFALHFGVLVNRGAMYGPWLPIYGFGCTFAILMFSKFKVLKKIQTNPIKTFLCVMVVCTIMEYLTSLYLELSTGERYWNYSGIFMNINGRVCLENSIFFGAGGCLCIYFVGPWLQKRIRRFSNKFRATLCIMLIVIFLGDVVATKIKPHYGDFISNDPSLETMNEQKID